ncbi:hypothetical protein ACFY3V_17385 [Streptosporangium sp. NPDC000095]|uniref:hypothetical protein n=1 Tax=Streptosporangium sp. NPDC000095 TaxID=3366184 RepID=UPI00368A40D8
MTAEDLQAWMTGLDEMFARVAGRFGRVEPRQRARAFTPDLKAEASARNFGNPEGRR